MIKDKCSDSYKCIYLYRRNDIYQELRELILQLRSQPAFHDMGYLAVSIIETDQAGEWGIKCKEWTNLEIELQFQTIYKPSDRKEEA